MKYIALEELQKYIIHDRCDEGCGYIDERDIAAIPTVDLDKIRAQIDKHKSTIDKAISEDELKIEGMKEAYTDCLEIIDKYKEESEVSDADCD